MILDYLSQLIGDIPAGYDIIVWVVAALFLLFLLVQVFSFIHVFFREVI